MDRRAFLASLAALSACAEPAPREGTRPPPPPQPPPLPTSGDAAFDTWRQTFLVQALQAGIPSAVLVREFTGVTPDPAVMASDNRQPEFSRPPITYMASAVSEGRVTTGRQKREQLTFLTALESRYGVSRDILIGVWAMETAFGAVQGDQDVIRSLATLAFEGRRRDWAEGELKAALRMIVSGEATRAQMKGSWAGAMGQSQFIPTTFLSTAVDGDGDGRRDIWGSTADALASAANLLARAGWTRGHGWAREAVLPGGFDYAVTDGPREAWSVWQARGVRLVSGAPFTPEEDLAGATLLLPAGHTGPAFLAQPNHFIIRRYNNSALYALGVGLLADRFAGGGPLATPWPQEAPMSLADRRASQVALRQAGFDPGEPDGLIGTRTRNALRAWQRGRARFTEEHRAFVNQSFEKFYAIDRYGSFTDGPQFERFCEYLHIPCERVTEHNLFNFNRLEDLYRTVEHSFDPVLLGNYYREKVECATGITVFKKAQILHAKAVGNAWEINLKLETFNLELGTSTVINATYAATNATNHLFGVSDLALTHEISEIAFVSSPQFGQRGLTVMDGPFGSIMPYGLSGLLSLSSVAYTHHKISFDALPRFDCQMPEIDPRCRPEAPGICTDCPRRPESNAPKMLAQMQQYFADQVQFAHLFSYYTIKSKLKASHIDDGRPTEISLLRENPRFYCLFAGKINSIYEVEKIG